MEIITRKQAIERGLKRYFTGKSCKRGHVAERRVVSCECLECEWGWRHRRRTAERRRRANNPKQGLLGDALRRARRKGVPFDLTVDDIVIPDTCPVLGLPLRRSEGLRASRDRSPSIDRIVPPRGYVRGNVVVVSMLANRIKSNATPEQIRKVADFYEKLAIRLPYQEEPPCAPSS